MAIALSLPRVWLTKRQDLSTTDSMPIFSVYWFCEWEVWCVCVCTHLCVYAHACYVFVGALVSWKLKSCAIINHLSPYFLKTRFLTETGDYQLGCVSYPWVPGIFLPSSLLLQLQACTTVHDIFPDTEKEKQIFMLAEGSNLATKPSFQRNISLWKWCLTAIPVFLR